ncbi:hypothetical protein PR202_gb23121 [Eleusine coracana subsp. coracana]|uniref:Uncharacterized protein n=1 Tax=Eleusine coracana subsp. coracana TaxID=191504 RepID=A0AAV5FI32_ELECO|nr:hypothetical protein PR202_gb23121 [Eleusine coracana subsp. coracana]
MSLFVPVARWDWALVIAIHQRSSEAPMFQSSQWAKLGGKSESFTLQQRIRHHRCCSVGNSDAAAADIFPQRKRDLFSRSVLQAAAPYVSGWIDCVGVVTHKCITPSYDPIHSALQHRIPSNLPDRPPRSSVASLLPRADTQGAAVELRRISPPSTPTRRIRHILTSFHVGTPGATTPLPTELPLLPHPLPRNSLTG